MWTQQQSRKGRRERQRHEQRNCRRSRNRNRELLVEFARQSAHEQGRHEHGAQHQDDGDQGGPDLVHGPARRFERGIPLFQIALDILDHDDGIVDDNSDREHQSEKRQIVERIAQHGEHGESPHQRYRYRQHRNDRCAGLLQEHHDHQDYQHDRFQQCVQDGVDALRYEFGRIVDNAVFHPLREGFRKAGHRFLDPLGRLQSV